MDIKKRLRLSVFALVAASALALTGCSTTIGGGSGASGGDDSVSIFWKGSEKAGIDAAVAAYKKANPDAKVTVTTADVEQYQATLRTQLSAGTAADVVFVWPAGGNPAALREIAKGGFLADQSDRPWASKYPDALKDLFTYEGKVYVMGPAVTSFGPWYNEKALTTAGLSAPAKWSDVVPFCKAARAAGKVAYALGASALNNTQNPLYGLVPDLVYGADPEFDSQLADGKTTFSDNAGWNTAMDEYQQMSQAGCFNDDATGISQDQQNTEVANGDAMGMFGIGFQLGALETLAPDGEFRLHPFSGDDNAKTDLMTVSNAGGAALNAKAKNKVAAQKFIDFLGSAEGLEAYNSGTAGTVPSIPTGKTSDDPNLVTITKYVADGRTVHFLNQFWPNARIEQSMYAGIQGMLTGSQKPSDILTAMDAAYKG